MLIVSRYSCGSMVGASTARTPFATSPLRSSNIASALGDLAIAAPNAVANACIAAFLIPTCRASSRLKARFVTNIESPFAKASNMNAASNRGKSLTALGIAPGAQCNQFGPIFRPHQTVQANANSASTAKANLIQRNPRRNQSAKKYSAINPTIAAPIIHHMRTAFGFALPRNHSNSSRLRSVVAATCASNSLARPTLAGADRAGVSGL